MNPNEYVAAYVVPALCIALFFLFKSNDDEDPRVLIDGAVYSLLWPIFLVIAAIRRIKQEIWTK